MRLFRALVLIAFVAGVSARAEQRPVRRDVVDEFARELVANFEKPATKSGAPRLDLEDLIFEVHLVDSRSVVKRVGGITYEEYLAARQELREKYGFTFSGPDWKRERFNAGVVNFVATRKRVEAEKKRLGLDVEPGSVPPSPRRTKLSVGESLALQASLKQYEMAQGPDVTIEIPRVLNRRFRFGETGQLQSAEGNSGGTLKVDPRQRGGNNLDLAFNLLKSTEVGTELLNKAAPLILSGEIEIRYLDGEIRKGASQCIAGRCETLLEQNGKRIVYVDPNEPLARLAPTLFHELFHATSASQIARRAAVKKLENKLNAQVLELKKVAAVQRKVSIDRVSFASLEGEAARALAKEIAAYGVAVETQIFEAERETHAAHEGFMKDLSAKFPVFGTYYDFLETKGHLSKDTSEDQIVSRYGLKKLAGSSEYFQAVLADSPVRLFGCPFGALAQ